MLVEIQINVWNHANPSSWRNIWTAINLICPSCSEKSWCQHDNGHSADLGIKSTQDDGVRRLSQNQSEKSKRIDVAEDLARINGSHANWNLKKYNALGWPHISQIKFSCQNLDALRKTFMLSAVHAHLAGTWAIYLSIFWAMSIHHTENKYACTMEPKDWEGRIASMFWPWQWRWADQSIKSH